MAFGLFLLIGLTPGAVRRNGPYDQLAVPPKDPGAFHERRLRIVQKTECQGNDYAIEALALKRQVLGSSNLRQNAPSYRYRSHPRGKIHSMGNSQRLCETTRSDADFEPTPRIVMAYTA